MPTERKKVFRYDRLRDEREARQMSQDDLADRLGFGASQLNRYENGKQDPSAEMLTRMAAELEVTTDYLLGISTEKHAAIRGDDLTPVERALIEGFRASNLEGRVRDALDGSSPDAKDEVVRPNAKKPRNNPASN